MKIIRWTIFGGFFSIPVYSGYKGLVHSWNRAIELDQIKRAKAAEEERLADIAKTMIIDSTASKEAPEAAAATG